ncbi:putative N-acetyltransferase YhbS [Melghiribacillus thermohalophilus]|uniref:Putative N-acetyltransferase YhbS n=1 Tax=Melghiribacillus thermohalophilus TaxID=1324956 RepID=A0A4R3MZ68_9BACI|nr:GNAT family N-acetyltransferase [Melghiribacillus thermohalophilus]TCT19609.1 putative N-acetyltransferase YhbS [Melghiribacillus thermohalophilus]
MDVMIRTLEEKDFNQLPSLLGDLGYPSSKEDVETRFKKIMGNRLYHTFVAELNGEITGLLGMHMEYSYVNNQPAARVIAMVVKAEHRNQGIGKGLMQKAEQTAREKGAYMMVLNSGNRDERQAAHRFYERTGFQGKATGFYKYL